MGGGHKNILFIIKIFNKINSFSQIFVLLVFIKKLTKSQFTMLRPSLRLLCPCNARCPYDVTALRDQHPRSSATSEFPRNHTRHRFRWMLHPYGDNVFNFRIQMSSTRRRIDLLLLLPRFCKTAYWMSFSLWFSKWLFIGFSAEF